MIRSTLTMYICMWECPGTTRVCACVRLRGAFVHPGVTERLCLDRKGTHQATLPVHNANQQYLRILADMGALTEQTAAKPSLKGGQSSLPRSQDPTAQASRLPAAMFFSANSRDVIRLRSSRYNLPRSSTSTVFAQSCKKRRVAFATGLNARSDSRLGRFVQKAREKGAGHVVDHCCAWEGVLRPGGSASKAGPLPRP